MWYRRLPFMVRYLKVGASAGWLEGGVIDGPADGDLVGVLDHPAAGVVRESLVGRSQGGPSTWDGGW